MPVLNIRNVPLDIHRKAKLQAVKLDMTLRDYIFHLIVKDIRERAGKGRMKSK